jgi:hypothetical protein
MQECEVAISEIIQHYNSEILKFDSPALVHSRILIVILLWVFLNSFYGPKERK